MATKTEIANIALAHLGEAGISDFDNSSEQRAIEMRRQYTQAISELGRMQAWNCLAKRATLTRDSVAPAFEWVYSYTLPADCIRVNELNGYDWGERQDYYEVEQHKLLTDAETAQIKYNCNAVDSGRFDSLFVEALALLIASKAALPIKQDRTLKENLYQQFLRVALPMARRQDSTEKRMRPIDLRKNSQWFNSRATGTNP